MKRAATKSRETLTKDNDGDVDRAQHAKLVGLLEETVLALQVREGADGRIESQ